ALARRGLPATGVVIAARTPAHGLRCFANYTTHPGWDRLRAWAREGWGFVSGGDHALLADATYEEKLADTGGSRAVFRAHGLSAVGMYAYADNAWSVATQHDPVSRCFLFGRRYGAHWINERSTTGAPWFQWTESVSGGRCHDPSLPCSRGARRAA